MRMHASLSHGMTPSQPEASLSSVYCRYDSVPGSQASSAYEEEDSDSPAELELSLQSSVPVTRDSLPVSEPEPARRSHGAAQSPSKPLEETLRLGRARDRLEKGRGGE
eukprot:548794-Rhodomonas_salina.1